MRRIKWSYVGGVRSSPAERGTGRKLLGSDLAANIETSLAGPAQRDATRHHVRRSEPPPLSTSVDDPVAGLAVDAINLLPTISNSFLQRRDQQYAVTYFLRTLYLGMPGLSPTWFTRAGARDSRERRTVILSQLISDPKRHIDSE